MFTINVRKQVEDISHWLGLTTANLEEFNMETKRSLTEEDFADDIVVCEKKTDENCTTTNEKTSVTSVEYTEKNLDVNLTSAQEEVKSFMNFIYSMANDTGKTLTEVGAKIKKTVKENSFLSEFNNEQEAFLQSSKQTEEGSAFLPWLFCPNEIVVKEQILALSKDKRNFLHNPPAGVNFIFNYDTSYPVAMAIMEQDPILVRIRYDLVPKVITENLFWKNYFYRVELVCRANELSLDSITQEISQKVPDKQDEQYSAACDDWEKLLEDELADYDISCENNKPDIINSNKSDENTIDNLLGSDI